MTLTLAALLERLNYTPEESYQLCSKAPGGTFKATVHAGHPEISNTIVDIWYGPNPVNPVTKGRPDAENITRLAALWADIDIDPAKCPDHETARSIVDDLSAMLGADPIAITYSGHGIQPIWAVEDGHIDATGGWERRDIRALLRRWGRLVVAVAGRRGAKVDSVWDLPRILRCPGSINHKNPLKPVPVICAPAGGTPLNIQHIFDVLDEQNIPEQHDDHRDPGAIISAPDQWTYVNGTCYYAQTMINGWANDTPTARHPWLLSQATRVAAAHRHACLSPAGHTVALGTLAARFHALLATGFINRDESPGEIQDAIAWGQARAAAMTDRDVLLELGTHTHWADVRQGRAESTGGGLPSNWGEGPTTKGTTYAPLRDVSTRTAPPPCGVTATMEPVLPDAEPQTAAAPVEQPLVDVFRRLTLTAASDIAPRPVYWTWDKRLAQGTLGLLAGREGLGKSTLGYWIAARISRGQLPGIHHGAPKGVLIVATEDSWEHTVVPRLMAAEADLTKIYRVEMVTIDNVHSTLCLPKDLQLVESAATEVEAALLLLDPLMSRLDSELDTHRDGEVRQALEPLVAIADKTGMAILGLIHHNKSGSSDPLQLVMGSKAFTAVARSVHTVIPDPDDEERRMFGTPKNNLGRTGLPTLTFTIASHAIDTSEGTAWTGRVEWGEEISDTIEETMRRAVDSADDRGATGEAADWLADYMQSKGGTVHSGEAKAAGKTEGHSLSSIDRARKKLKLTIASQGMPRRTWWSSPAVSPVTSTPLGRHTIETTETTGGNGHQSPQSFQLPQSFGSPREADVTGKPRYDQRARDGLCDADGCGNYAEPGHPTCWRCS